MNVSKFEAVGIGVSVAAMALALFLLRLDGAALSSTGDQMSDAQLAAVVVADNEVEGAARADAIVEASSSGRVDRLIIDDVTIGDGDMVEEGDTVSVHYIGTLQNGQQFDNSYAKGTPFEFTVGDGKAIAGWEQGIIGMKEGGERILVVPPELGYGENGYGPIPGNATLVFAIELLEIK